MNCKHCKDTKVLDNGKYCDHCENNENVKQIHKFNGGNGATLCTKCGVIITVGFTRDLYCKDCKDKPMS